MLNWIDFRSHSQHNIVLCISYTIVTIVEKRQKMFKILQYVRPT